MPRYGLLDIQVLTAKYLSPFQFVFRLAFGTLLRSHSALPLSFRLKTPPLFAKKDMTVSLFSVYFIELFAKDKSVFYLEIALENTALEK